MSLPTVEELNAALLLVREGGASADSFFRLARPKLRLVARDIWHGWRRKLPAHVEFADIEQVLCCQVLEHVPRWCPERCERIWDYVIWSAVHRTQRQIHKWRGAQIHGNEGKNKSRAELAFSRAFGNDALYQEDPGSRIDAILVKAAPPKEDPEGEAARERKFDELLQQTETVREAFALQALKEHDGSVQHAAAALWGDFHARVECGLTSERQALAVVREAIEAIARRCVIAVPLDLWDDDAGDDRAQEVA